MVTRKQEIETAKDKLEELLVEQDALATRIAKHKRILAHLIELSSLEDDSTPAVGLVTGITDACRTVLRAATSPLLPVEVRDRVQQLGLPEQRNLLASVHTVLRRLVEGGEVIPVPPKQGSGPIRFQWNKSVTRMSDLLR
jgi:hypothetical protein